MMKQQPSLFHLSARLWYSAPLPAFVAAVVYLLTLAQGLTPGNSAELTATAAGLIPPSEEAHPLFAWITRAVASLDCFSLVTRLNLFSVTCAVFCALLFYPLVARFILFSAFENERRNEPINDDTALTERASPEEERQHNRYVYRIAIFGGFVATYLLLFTVPTWSAATRLDRGFFDLLLLVISLSFFPTRNDKNRFPRLLASVFFFTLGMLESAVFLLLMPCYGFFLFRHWFFTSRRTRLALGLMATALGAVLVMFLAYSQNVALPKASFFSLIPQYLLALPRSLYHELRAFIPYAGWGLPLVQVGLTTVILFFGRRILFQSKKSDTLIATVLLLFAAVPGLLALSLSPQSLCDPLFRLPVFTYALIAVGAAVAWSASLLMLESEPEDDVLVRTKRNGKAPFAKTVAMLLFPFFLVLVVVVPLRSYPRIYSERGAFVDAAINALLDTLQGQDWVFSNGVLDHPLRIRAYMRKQPLTIVSLRPQDAAFERKRLHALIATHPLFAEQHRTRLQNALLISCGRFATEWLSTDPSAAAHVAILTSPDLWSASGYRAIPEGLAFGGLSPNQKPDGPRLSEIHRRFTQRILPLLIDQPLQSRTLAALREMLRLRMGFVTNELGVLLEEMGDYEAAYQTYSDAAIIDPQNLSVALNHYALAITRKLHPDEQDKLKKRARTLLADNRQASGGLMRIFQQYGTIRMPTFYRQQAALWTASGRPLVAADKLRKAMALSDHVNAASFTERAACFEQLGDTQHAEACYREAWERDASNREALSGLCRLAIVKQEIATAEKWLNQAIAAGIDRDQQLRLLIDLALLKNDLPRARTLLKEATRNTPEDAAFWSRLADVMIKQGEPLVVENVLLPEMTQKLHPMDHYLIHAIKGVLICKKGPRFLREGRRSLLKALALNAAQPNVWNLLLTSDMAIGDRSFIEADARTLLSQEPNHTLANYLMGSILLHQNKREAAEDFLRRSIERQPTAMACNDLAECLRQQHRLQEAESYARKAIALDSKLTAALDTLACVLYDLGKHAEALHVASQAVAIEPEQPAYQLTLLRILIRHGDTRAVHQKMAELDRARITIPDDLRKEVNAPLP